MSSFRIFDFLDSTNFLTPNANAFVYRKKGEWLSYTFEDYKHKSNLVSKALFNLNIKKGDLVGSISANRPEWNFLDIGILQIGAVHVALHPSYSIHDILYILNQTKLTYFFCGNRILYKMLLSHLSELNNIKGVYCFDDGEGIESWSSILPNELNDEDLEKINELKNKTKPSDIATILYTSGTGGNPKGTIHTHESFIASTSFLVDCNYLENSQRAFSILSISHTFERLHYYIYLKSGITVYYADNNTPLIEQIKEIQPNVMVCVPLMIENFYKTITEKYIQENNTEAIEAINYTRQFDYSKLGDFYNSLEYKKHLSFYDEWYKLMGGALKMIITGAAVIPEYLVRFFGTINIPLFECYGSTEATFHTINHQKFKYKIGTVGVPINQTKIKITEDDEIWVNTKGVMKGYYKLSKLTKAVLDEDNWYHTGDTGFIDEYGMLHIVGRTNTVFKMMNGKYLNPESVEKQLCAYHLINNVFITQDESRSLLAVISTNINSISEGSKNEIIHFIQETYNANTVESERIKFILFTADIWTIETEEYTPTMKLKRINLINKYEPFFKQAIEIN